MGARDRESRLRRWGLTALLALLVPVSWASPAVERVSFTPRADGQGYVVRIHTSETIVAYSEPLRSGDDVLELILFNTGLAAACRKDPPQGPVRAYELVQKGQHLHLRFSLADPQVVPRVYRDRETTDLLLGLTTPEVSGPVARHVEPASDARERWRLDTIVIDPGHGGRDTGAIGAGGLREKDLVLAVARKLGQYLEERLGVRVVYTREDDRFIPLKERGHMANEAGGKLFISLHANASRNRSARGTETYFLGMHKTAAARAVMERENSVIRFEEDQEHYKNFDERDLIRMQLIQSAYMRQSEYLAGLVEQQFAERVGRKSRGVKQAGFYVLWSASMPALLVELGFISNPEEAAFLRSEDGQAYMASAIFRAVRAFKHDYEKGLHLVSAQ
ncbi:N-acetylmuramoyl-L-alanine amidase [Rhodocaloribacter litoris]|nr:N-acetylmuramoyl-L-alanine amidase [Rhodocaloribacter litoris]